MLCAMVEVCVASGLPSSEETGHLLTLEQYPLFMIGQVYIYIIVCVVLSVWEVIVCPSLFPARSTSAGVRGASPRPHLPDSRPASSATPLLASRQ